LDRLDLRLLKSLLVNNGVPPGVPVLRKSFRSMGKELGVDQGTVRKRIKRFQENRILKGWYLGVNPGVEGNDIVHGWFAVGGESAKYDLIGRLLSVPEVERVCNYLGPKMSIVLFSKKGMDHDTTLRRLAGKLSPEVSLHKQGVIVTSSPQLKKTDSEIIASLRRDPWKSYVAVSDEVGISARTIKRRVTSLSEEGVIYMLPIIDLKALQGAIPVELLIDYVSNDAKTSPNEKIATRIKERLIFSNLSGPYGYFALLVANVAEVDQIVSWVGQLSGIRNVQAELLQDVILNQRHYEGERLSEGQAIAEPSRVDKGKTGAHYGMEPELALKRR
jgi:DNA-binding Lrp family transcriptional regulator